MFSRILFILFAGIIALAGLYSLYGIGHFKYMYYKLDNPKAEFQVIGEKNADITIVEFLNYGCGYCKEMHPYMKEILTLYKDVKFVARPIVFGDENMTDITKTVLAAGLQGKFWEMHDAVMEYPEIEIPESFIEETASLYGIDYEKLISDRDGKEVQKIADNNLGAMELAGLYAIPSLAVNDEFYIITNDKLPSLQEILDIVANAAAKK